MRSLTSALVLVLGGLCLGCGGGGEEYKHAVEPESEEVIYAEDVRSYLRDMKQQVQVEGPQAVDATGYLEGMEGYGEDPPVGEHGATYEKIHAGVRELDGMLKSGASRADVAKKIDELLALTEPLPKRAAAAPSGGQ